MLERGKRTWLWLILAGVWLWGQPPEAVVVGGAARPACGWFDALTYNVAGLPQGISASRPAEFSGRIGALLEPYDLVLLQEDFCYHQRVVAPTSHAFRTGPRPAMVGTLVGDGLSRLSRIRFDAPRRERWCASSGIFAGYCDALAAKGFTCAATEVAPGLFVDVYNLHADAGENAPDREARRMAFAQLAEHIETHSAGRAVIVGGDFNARWSDAADREILEALLARTGLRDAAQHLGVRDDHVDRFLFRAAPTLALRPVHWSPAREFVTAEGEPLSDHAAIHVRFAWRARGRDRQGPADAPHADAEATGLLAMPVS